jgi:hypothetical protein
VLDIGSATPATIIKLSLLETTGLEMLTVGETTTEGEIAI